MTFATIESSRALGQPIGLLLFTSGNDVYAYTDAEQAVTYNDNTYTPVPSDRDSITASGTLDKTQLEISLPQDCPLSELFDVWPPSDVVNLTIFQGHVDNADFSIAWVGRVVSNRIETNTLIVTCVPISTSLNRIGLRRRYGYGCPLALYGTGQGQCNASKTAATISVAVQAVSGATVTLPAGWNGGIDTSKYNAGVAQWTTSAGRTEYRQIIGMADDTDMNLSGDASTIPAGGNIALSLGCSHQPGDCTSLHNNINNYGGQLWIPTYNPVGVTNNFF
jgi:hypothetical protein